MSVRASWIALTIVLFLGVSWGDKNKSETSPAKPIDQDGRFAIIRALNGELVFARKPFPMGTRGLVIRSDGKLVPDGQQLQQAVAVNGAAAKPGDRVHITNLIIKNKMIIFEINGGPLKKKKWYDRLEVGSVGGSTTLTKPPDELARGSFVALEFDKFVPKITPDELKERLGSVLDFNAKSTMEAYLETLPPKARQAIQDHKVLVGMNRQLVLYAVGAPERKIREKENDVPYEEWIYGYPPEEVKFVRFVGDEVTQLKIMQVDGQKVLRTAKEIDLKTGTEQAQAKPQPPPPPPHAPTLRRPGEKAGVETSSTAAPDDGTPPKQKVPTVILGDPNHGTRMPEPGEIPGGSPSSQDPPR
ncbi:MAG TPA: hypothetical protein VMS96_08340 [Terriglobales bacterium]|nr:hypothetical protein [Terriglobales bacterium]